MLATKDLYMKACMQSKELHAMTDEERTRLQAHLRMMYKEIEKVCNRHGLNVCAGYGTVLGALRHQGFIPWDDDMDLLMPREDYDKLINEYADELPANLRIYAPNSKNGPIYRFAKVVDVNTKFISPGASDDESHGVFIDIFPLEYVPKKRFVLAWRNFYTRILLLIAACVAQKEENNQFYGRLMCSNLRGTLTYNIREFIGFLFAWRDTSKWYNRIANYTFYKRNTDRVNIPTDGGLKKSLEPLLLNSYFPARKVKFDDIDILVPKDAEDYLVHNYGDWSWIPPVEKRWQHFIEKLEL